MAIKWHRSTSMPRLPEMVEKMRRSGGTEGADVWLRNIVAIGTLGTPPTDSRH